MAETEQIACHSIIPGRLLHVRCTKPRDTLDLVAGYQWVWQANKQDVITKQRHSFWTKLGKLLHDLPVRNLLLMGMDLNSGIKPLPGLIGRGVMHTNRHAETELEARLQVHHLVLLNTWSQASPERCHTFFNHGTRTQLGFVITRRLTTDALSRLSRPLPLDLTLGGKGPNTAQSKLVCSGLQAGPEPGGPQVSANAMSGCSDKQQRREDRRRKPFSTCLFLDPPSLALVNSRVLKQLHHSVSQQALCCTRPGETPKVRSCSCIADMWRQHRLFKSLGECLGPANIRSAWRQHSVFQSERA